MEDWNTSRRSEKSRSLDLTHSNVGDAGLAHLVARANLKSLNLRSTKVTDRGLEHLKALTKLESLNLSQTVVTNAGLEKLRGLRQLRSLDLARMKKVSGEGVKRLAASDTRVRNIHATFPRQHNGRPELVGGKTLAEMAVVGT